MEIPPVRGAGAAPFRLALRHGVALVNAPGTIDADYRGKSGDRHQPWQEQVTFTPGERIAQLVIARSPGGLPRGAELGETRRNAGVSAIPAAKRSHP